MANRMDIYVYVDERKMELDIIRKMRAEYFRPRLAFQSEAFNYFVLWRRGVKKTNVRHEMLANLCCNHSIENHVPLSTLRRVDMIERKRKVKINPDQAQLL